MVYISKRDDGSNWEFTFDRKEMFEQASYRSVQIADRYLESQDNREMMEDDRDLFDSYYSLALAELMTEIARNLIKEFSDYNIDGDKLYITLSMKDYHDDSMSFVLDNYIKEYIITKCLKEWFGPESNNTGVDESVVRIELGLRTALKFRKRAAKLPIHPIF